MGGTPAAIKQGVADALDPAVGALNVFGFKDVLSWVTFIRSVPDAQVYSCNLKWYDSLNANLKNSLEQASEATFRQNLASIPAARAYAMFELAGAGVQFYVPTPDEFEQWPKVAGFQHDEWTPFIENSIGSRREFDKLRELTKRQSSYYVDDV